MELCVSQLLVFVSGSRFVNRTFGLWTPIVNEIIKFACKTVDLINVVSG